MLRADCRLSIVLGTRARTAIPSVRHHKQHTHSRSLLLPHILPPSPSPSLGSSHITSKRSRGSSAKLGKSASSKGRRSSLSKHTYTFVFFLVFPFFSSFHILVFVFVGIGIGIGIISATARAPTAESSIAETSKNPHPLALIVGGDCPSLLSGSGITTGEGSVTGDKLKL